MTSCPIPIGETFAGKYRVDRILGEGGMGVVVAAHHLELDQPVAIKFLLGDLSKNPEGEERFRREARAAAKIQSDHVVRVLDVGFLDSGERFMVMEYLLGQDLSQVLQERGALPTEQAVRYVLEALDAIAQAHAAGIIHRDLKPANLFLCERADGSKRVKVLDFGISKSLGTATSEQLSLTKTSAWIGSPLYMAPEQMQSARDVDVRADIWSLGAILYELLSGQPPYMAESLPQLCNLLLTKDPQPLKELRPELTDALCAAVMRCLRRPVDERWQRVAELGEALLHAQPTFESRLSLHSMGQFGLAATDVLATPATLVPPPEAAQRSPTGTLASGQAAPAALAGRATAGAWGATRNGDDADAKRSKMPAFALAAVAVVGLGVGGWLWSRGGEAAPEVLGPEATVSAAAALDAGDGAAARPMPVAAPSASEPAPSAAPSSEAAVAALAAAAPQPTTSETPRPAAPRAPAPPVHTPKAAAPKSSPKAAPAPSATESPATTEGGLSDFGGRR